MDARIGFGLPLDTVARMSCSVRGCLAVRLVTDAVLPYVEVGLRVAKDGTLAFSYAMPEGARPLGYFEGYPDILVCQVAASPAVPPPSLVWSLLDELINLHGVGARKVDRTVLRFLEAVSVRVLAPSGDVIENPLRCFVAVRDGEPRRSLRNGVCGWALFRSEDETRYSSTPVTAFVAKLPYDGGWFVTDCRRLCARASGERK